METGEEIGAEAGTELYEFEASLVCIQSSMTSIATQRDSAKRRGGGGIDGRREGGNEGRRR